MTILAHAPDTIDAAGGWWTCPDWCDGMCWGGYRYPGTDIVVARVHTLHRYVGPGIKVVDEQAEDADTGHGERVTVLYAGQHAYTLTDPTAVLAVIAALTGGA